MSANSYLPANTFPPWPFGAATGNDLCMNRADTEKNTDVNQPSGDDIKVIKESGESSTKVGLKACPSVGCAFRAKTKRDVERHNLAIHEKTALFFCEYSECNRKGGWSRKDLRDRHEKTVHGRQRNGKPRSVLRAREPLASLPKATGRQSSEPAEATSGVDDSLSRKEALRQLYEERRMRLEAERELQILRKEYEERDCMLLKILAGKVLPDQE